MFSGWTVFTRTKHIDTENFDDGLLPWKWTYTILMTHRCESEVISIRHSGKSQNNSLVKNCVYVVLIIICPTQH